MEIIRTVAELKAKLNAARENGSIGLVPTMGALHAGHLSLIERARRENDTVVVSVFVNPTQFNNPNDLATYPRTEEADTAMLCEAGVDYAFIPSVEEIYPEPDTRQFALGSVAEVMEGAMRPGHFNGVAQIVSKLFDFTRPTRAYFGEKDFQQIAVIRKMVELEGFDLEIVDCPIKREADGLAMSSRNVRLTPEQRAIAPAIHKALEGSLSWAADHSVEETKRYVIDEINSFPQMEVEYYEIVDALTMQPVSDWAETDSAVGCVTVFCGDVRLIDNIKYPKRK
ncbi:MULTISPECIES: pantoate--beta-alanine ligase [Duncaniella]|jgi:pantoate--beta-alanine ligase|uniref:Pantothenate synthetase n=3 Tax=Duncaniella TaxID=2518495 RepID=A0A4V1D3J7_9BACT|nr:MULTISPECIES: pantoate--beta-alanine ligase [Duncaniella]MBJ2190095.1 pantoate--beta-alanine ligase [Muribaculaceae bacterium]ROS87894.1 pantoate--beta-alanine ligase [Muribaculaceae bacterium Isolate-080 (Janvier)]HBN63132.1 pantoate--beta-alanine ligase [Porphyromonadaceae bacterium]MCX4284075.1 pantoate--beta-alanine ligase [Duncaniella dubosii]QCD43248.1 pantoate--beta-alanine ligase [Duncaniella dubosii]